jgi:hypothetical protein
MANTGTEASKKFYKIVILGGGGVGKSCLTFRLVHDRFEFHRFLTGFAPWYEIFYPGVMFCTQVRSFLPRYEFSTQV